MERFLQERNVVLYRRLRSSSDRNRKTNDRLNCFSKMTILK